MRFNYIIVREILQKRGESYGYGGRTCSRRVELKCQRWWGGMSKQCQCFTDSCPDCGYPLTRLNVGCVKFACSFSASREKIQPNSEGLCVAWDGARSSERTRVRPRPHGVGRDDAVQVRRSGGFASATGDRGLGCSPFLRREELSRWDAGGWTLPCRR